MTTQLNEFRLDGLRFKAEQCVDGVLINPKMPAHFDQTPNEERPATHTKWWNRPYIVTESVVSLDAFYMARTTEASRISTDAEAAAHKAMHSWQETERAQWMCAWPSGVRYTARCLDGGAWDRSTNWGSFATLEEALLKARHGPWT